MLHSRWDFLPSWSTMIHDRLWSWAGHLLAAALVLLIGIAIAHWLGRLAARALERFHYDLTLARFLDSAIKIALYLVVFVAALGQLGVETTSLLAMLGAAGLAIGLALQKSLSDFAAGVLLLLLRPYTVGDTVEVAGISGTVERIHLFQSILISSDNRRLSVPNGKIVSGVITNNSVLGQRRIDLVLAIAQDADLRRALGILPEVVAAETRVLADPAPSYGVLELTETSVQLFARPWVLAADYANTRSALLEAIKVAFDEAGVALASRQTLAVSHTEPAAS